MITPLLRERFAFFHENGGGIVGRSAEGALALARAEETAQRLGLEVVWEDETDPWDGDCPAPNYLLCGLVYRPEDLDANARPRRRARPLASLGMVGVNSTRDPYLRVVEAELYAEALCELDKEWQAEADKLAERPTLAGVSP